MTLQEYARIYVDTINGPANGWGQHVHPTLGPTHAIMGLMWRKFGREESNAAIDAAFKESKP